MGEMNKVLLMLTIAIVVTTCVAARNEYSEQPEEKQLLARISNILVEGARARGSRVVSDDNNLSCWPQNEHCNPWDASKSCCDGSKCDAHLERCVWCPRRGDSCGLGDPCCPGFSCDGWFTGTCS